MNATPDPHRRLAILVGGGPAPGINSVIGAATIRACLEGVEVVGVRDGFEWLMRGDIDHVTPLTIDLVSRIHFSSPWAEVRHAKARIATRVAARSRQ